MPFDPEDVLGVTGATQADPGKGTKPSSGFDPLDVKAVVGNSTARRNLIGGTIDPNTNFSQFRFQPKTNADNYMIQAQDQGFWESLGKTLGNTAANIPIDMVQGLGYLATTMEFGDDRNYTNSLVKEMDKIKNPFGQVYREHPNEYFDPADSAWWLDNLGQLAESSASFALEGVGIAKLFGTIAKTAAWSARSASLGAKAAQGLSAAALTYTEGAMSGAQVYETAYNNNYMKMISQGTNPTEADSQAKHIASQAAAATVQLHTVMNLGLNVTGLTPLFRDEEQVITRWWRKNGTALPGETTEAWAARIAEAAPEGTPLKKLLGLGLTGPSRLGVEAFQEGLEEVNTQYAEHVGKAIGEKKEDKSVATQLFNVDRYFREVLNQEGALNFVLGSLGGLAQTVLLDHMPVHKVIKYGHDGTPLMSEDGKPQMERVSSHTRDERMNHQYFENIRDALGKDMTWLGEKNKDLQEALASGDKALLARTRADMLSVHNLRAISMGLGDVWKNQYQDIASLDNTRSLSEDLNSQIQELDRQIEEDRGAGDQEGLNQKQAQRYELLKQQSQLQDTTEAMQKGYADDKSDNTYKERAQQAITNLDYLTKLYHDMQDKFSAPEHQEAGLAEHMFYRQANLYLHKQQLDMMDTDLMKLRTRVDAMALTSHDDMLVKQAQTFLADKDVWDTTVKKLNNDIQRVNQAVQSGDNAVFLKMLDKYKIPATKDAATNLVQTLERRKTELQRRADDTTKELNDTIAVWQQTNPNGKVKDVIQKASERPILEDLYKQNKAYHQQGVIEYETAKEQLSKDSTQAGLKRIMEENKPPSQKQFDKEHVQAYDQQMDREIAAGMDAKQKQQQVDKINQRMVELQNQLSGKQVQIQALKRQQSNIKGFFKNLSQRSVNRETINQLQSEIHEANYEMAHLAQRRATMTQATAQATQAAQNVSRTPPPVVQPVTTTTAASTPSPNTTVQQQATTTEEEQHNDNLPDFDFGQEVIPHFTTTQEGNPVFDQIVGGNEAGTALRQFIQVRKDATVPFLVNAVKTLLQRSGLPALSAQEIEQFVTPYVTTLKNEYLAQKPDAAQEYESIKSFLKPAALEALDKLEWDFRGQGEFSYDRTIAVLNYQVSQGNLEKNMVGLVANRLKSFLEMKEDPVVTEPVQVQPAPVITTPVVPEVTTPQNTNQPNETTETVDQLIQWLNNNSIEQRYKSNDALHRLYESVKGGSYRKSGKYATSLLDEAERKLRNFLYPSSTATNPIVTPYQVQPIVSEDFNEQPRTYIAPVTESEPTTFSNAALELENVQRENKVFIGASNVETIKANFNTNPYTEFDNGKEIRIVADYTKLDPHLNTDVLLPGVINPGDTVELVVDQDWSGNINYDSEMIQDEYGEQLRRSDMFQNYLDSTGKIGMNVTATHPKGAHANVPIKIVHKNTGKVIGYLPRADWILAKYPDTQNYRNVVDEYKDEQTDVTDNVARQYSRIMKLREAIVRAWNTDKSLTLNTAVSQRGTGHVMINRETNPNTGRQKLVNRSAKNMLPDPGLEIAIMKQGSAYVGSGILSQKQLANLPAYLKNATSLPVAMLPSPDGTHVPTPLYTHKLGDNPSSMNTVVSAVEMYLRNSAGSPVATDTKAMARIQEATGFDIRTPEGLRSFVQQYFTYTQKFGEKDTVITPSEVTTAANPQFMLDIPDLVPGEKTSFIKVGTSFSGEKPIYAQLVNGELHPDFEQALREGLQDRFKSVIFAGKELRGINSQGEFKAPIIKKDGTVQVNTYKDYNEFVKASSVTFAYGLNKVGNQYVYMANPVVQLDYDQALRGAPPTPGTAISQQTTTRQTGEENIEEHDELADLFGNGSLSPTPGSITPITTPSQGSPISLELLQDLRNFTPEAHRNTESPEKVLRELLARGVTVLADGHNPFYTC